MRRRDISKIVCGLILLGAGLWPAANPVMITKMAAARQDTGPAWGDIFIDGAIGDASTLIPPWPRTLPPTRLLL